MPVRIWRSGKFILKEKNIKYLRKKNITIFSTKLGTTSKVFTHWKLHGMKKWNTPPKSSTLQYLSKWKTSNQEDGVGYLIWEKLKQHISKLNYVLNENYAKLTIYTTTKFISLYNYMTIYFGVSKLMCINGWTRT